MSDEILTIDENEPCPEVSFDFEANRFSLSGTCYPENTREFFDPIMARFTAHLEALEGADVEFQLRLTYFNSGASRIFSQMFDALEACATAGNTVRVIWCYEDGDDNMEELAEDFEEDFEAATYEVRMVDII